MIVKRMPILLLNLAATGVVAAEPPSKGASYVALGSSFAAGPGIATQLGSCGRSDRNYPHLVAAALELELTDVSCGGATTANILDTPQGGATPQLAAVGADAALITVTIGGNDIAYSASTIRCGDAKADERCAAKLDQARIAALGQQLEDAMVGAATAKGVLVADPYVLAEGHGPCAAEGDRWVNGAKPARSGASFHPTSKGHEEMARLVMAALKH